MQKATSRTVYNISLALDDLALSGSTIIMDRSRTRSLTPPPAPRTHRSSKNRRRHRAYSLTRGEKSPRRRSEITLLLCVFNTSSHNWSTQPLRFNPDRINDRELWTDIRDIFRTELHPLWKRILGFKRVKSIVPIGVSFPFTRMLFWTTSRSWGLCPSSTAFLVNPHTSRHVVTAQQGGGCAHFVSLHILSVFSEKG